MRHQWKTLQTGPTCTCTTLQADRVRAVALHCSRPETRLRGIITRIDAPTKESVGCLHS
jgi:hypothetical protein